MTLGSEMTGHATETRVRAGIALLDVVPELRAAVPADQVELAERVLSVPLARAADEDLAELLIAQGTEAFDFVVVDGLVLKETTFHQRSALELLSSGDVLVPPLTASRQLETPAISRYLAHGDVTLAVLDERFRQAARKWPGLSDVLHDRLGQQVHRASRHLAMLHIARVDDRIVALFHDLASRYGMMTAEGAVIDVPLTHDVIGRLVGSRRPTVTLALTELASAGTLTRDDDGRWLLSRSALAAGDIAA